VDGKGGKVVEKEGVQELYRLHKSKVVLGEDGEELDGPGQVGGSGSSGTGGGGGVESEGLELWSLKD